MGIVVRRLQSINLQAKLLAALLLLLQRPGLVPFKQSVSYIIMK